MLATTDSDVILTFLFMPTVLSVLV